MSSRSQALIGLGLVAASGIIYLTWSRRNKTWQWEEVGKVDKLVLYPVKSGVGCSVQKATATPHGLQTECVVDRSFVVVMDGQQNKKVHVTSAMAPMLGTVAAALTPGSVKLSSRLCTASVNVDINNILAEKKMVQFFMKLESVEGYDCGDEAAAWLRALLYRDTEEERQKPLVRLVYVGDANIFKRPARKPDYFPFPAFKPEDIQLYHDVCGFMLTCPSSLDDLNSKLQSPVTMEQLRGNIVVSGRPAFDEDDWAYVKIGNKVILRTLKPREACIRVNVNPTTGQMQKEVLDTLRKYRVPAMPPALDKHWNQKPFFGLHMAMDESGDVAVGDKVYAIRKKPHWLL